MDSFLLMCAIMARDIPRFGGRSRWVTVEPSHVVQGGYHVRVSEVVAKAIGVFVSSAEETRRFARGGTVITVVRGVNRRVGVAVSAVAVDCYAFLLGRVNLLQRVAPSAWSPSHDALVLILLYVVHGRIVTVPRVAGVDAYEQKLDEVGCNLWDTFVPWETRRDVALAWSLGFLPSCFLMVPSPKCTLFFSGLPSVPFADLLPLRFCRTLRLGVFGSPGDKWKLISACA